MKRAVHSVEKIICSLDRTAAERAGRRSTLFETAKMNDVEPYAYLCDVFQRMVEGHPINRLNELLPWDWRLQNLSRPEATCSAHTLTQAPQSNLTPFVRQATRGPCIVGRIVGLAWPEYRRDALQVAYRASRHLLPRFVHQRQSIDEARSPHGRRPC